MSKEYFIVVSNHKSMVGISDHILMLFSLFPKDITLKVTNDIVDGKNNIIIDEFTNLRFNRDIKRSYSKNTKFFLVATEFITKKNKFKTFNSFEISWLNIISIKLLLPFYKYLDKFKFKRSTPKFRNIISIKLLLPLYKYLGKYILSLIINLSYKTFASRRFIYDYFRYDGFSNNIKYFSKIIVFHKELYNQYFSFIKENNLNCEVLETLFPIIDKKKLLNNLKGKKYSFYMTGTITPYRQAQFNALKKNIQSSLDSDNSLNYYDCEFFIKSFNNESPLPNYLFSYHPPQTINWKFSSPIRIYRSLCVDFSIPIVDKYFNDHPIEKLCLKIDKSIYSTTNKLFLKKKTNHDLNKLIDSYNSFANKNNKKILCHLLT